MFAKDQLELKILELDSTCICHIPIKDMTNLEKLNIQKSRIEFLDMRPCHDISKLELSVYQVIQTYNKIQFTLDLQKPPLHTQTDYLSVYIYDTQQYFGLTNVSLGTANAIKMDDELISFSDNTICTFDRLNEEKLVCCQFLNLRHASIGTIEFSYLT